MKFEQIYEDHNQPKIWVTLNGNDKSEDELHQEVKCTVKKYLEEKKEQTDDDLYV